VIPSRSLSPGDIIRVRPGDTLAADGTVVNGQSAIDESMLTGEYLPVSRRPGDAVSAGTLNTENPWRCAWTRPGTKPGFPPLRAFLIVPGGKAGHGPRCGPCGHLVRERCPHRRRSYVCGLEPDRAGTCILHCTGGTRGHLPCALSLATPTALTVATSALREKSFLPTRGTTLEALSTVDTLVFDKTGTLTQGRLNITGVQLLGSLTRPIADNWPRVSRPAPSIRSQGRSPGLPVSHLPN